MKITAIILILLLILNTHLYASSIEEGKKAFNEGMELAGKSDYKGALEKLEKALCIFEENNYDRGIFAVSGMMADVYYYSGNYTKSLEYYNKAREISIKTSDPKGEGNCLKNMGDIYFELNDYKNALEYYDKSLNIFIKSGNVSEEGTVSGNIAMVYLNLYDYKKSLEYFDKALEISKKTGNLSEEGRHAGNKAILCYELGNYKMALEYYNKALEISENKGDVKQKGNCYFNLGNLYRTMGDYKKALEYYNKALEIAKKSGNIKEEGIIRGNMGVLYKNRGDYKKAYEYYNKALEIAINSGDLKEEGIIRGNLGVLYKNWGDYDISLAYYNKSLEISQKNSDIKGEISGLSNLAGLYMEKDDYSMALKYYNKALNIISKVNHIKEESSVLCNLAIIYKNLGDYSKSLDYLNKSLELVGKIGYPEGESKVLSNMATVYIALGDYSRALTYYGKALEISRTMGDITGEGLISADMGTIYLNLHDYSKALEYYNKALDINKKHTIPSDWIEGNIGDIYLASGKPREAYEIYKRLNLPLRLGRYFLVKKDYIKAKEQFSIVLKHAEEAKKAETLIAVYIGLGLSEENLENYKDAEKYYLKAVESIEHQRDSLLQTERQNFFEGKVMGFSRLEPYEGLVRIYHHMNLDGKGFLYGENTKARLLWEEMAKKYEGPGFKLPPDIMDKDRALVNSIALKYKEMERAYENDNKKYKEFEGQLNVLLKEQNKFIGDLRKNYPEYASIMYPKPLNAEEIRLKPGEFMIEYEVTENETMAWLISNGKILKTISFKITREDLAKLVSEYRSSFELKGNKEVDDYNLEHFKGLTGKKLYDLLLKDFMPSVKNEKIIIIPDEILGLLPFETLVSEIPDKFSMKKGVFGPYPEGLTYAGDSHNIIYYQSGSALTILRDLKKASGKKGLMAIADPLFSEKDERITGAVKNNSYILQGINEKDIPRLKGTGELVGNLKKIFPEIKIYKDLEASEKNVKKENLSDYHYLLFATHGILAGDFPYIKEPALILSLVNNTEEDGFLTMGEVMNINMTSDVAVLSACKTGIGKLTGEGVMGMGRAFQYSGVKSVLMSLWSVEEKSTNLMIEKYFEYLEKGDEPGQALRKARNYIRKSGYEHPVFWGAFILVGD